MLHPRPGINSRSNVVILTDNLYIEGMSNWRDEYESHEEARANAYLADTGPETVEPEWDGEYDENEPF